jgi:anti-sigma regulatory factor (Ser/Thr protein kinase)
VTAADWGGRLASDRLLDVLSHYVSPIIARSLFQVGLRRSGIPESRASVALTPAFLKGVVSGLKLYVPDAAQRRACEREVEQLLGDPELEQHVIPLTIEGDIVQARARARLLAVELGFNHTDQVRIATAVSEIARNALSYAGGGEVQIEPLAEPKPGIRVSVRDSGPGIRELSVILSGGYSSKTGLGLGMRGCRELMDEFHVETALGAGTTITMTKYAP